MIDPFVQSGRSGVFCWAKKARQALPPRAAKACDCEAFLPATKVGESVRYVK